VTDSVGFGLPRKRRINYPLTWSALWLEWRLWGDQRDGLSRREHRVARRQRRSAVVGLRRLKIPGLAGRLVFAIHPVNVATVAWISEQKNTLSDALLPGRDSSVFEV